MAKRKVKKKPTLEDVVEQSERTSTALGNKIKGNQKALLTSIESLEKRVVSEFATLRVSDLGNLVGPRVNLKKAQHLHTRLVALFEEEYGTVVREQIGGYNEVAGWIKDNFKEFDVIAKYTDIDRTMMTQLRKQNLLEFTNIGRDAQTRISQAMYNSIAAGAPFSDLIKEVTGSLIGHKDARGRPLSKYAELYANDGVMNFYNSVHIEKGKQAGLNHMLYVGNVMGATRDFCATRAMKVYTINQINSWKHNWSGKRGPAMIFRGGWNCRHHWRPVKKDWVIGKEAEEGIQAPPGLVPLVKGEGRSWEDFTKAERSKLSTMRRKMGKDFEFKANSPRVKWWNSELNQAERNMFIGAWESEGINVSAVLKKGFTPGKVILPKPSKVTPPVPKPEKIPEVVVKPEPPSKLPPVIGDPEAIYLAAKKAAEKADIDYKAGKVGWRVSSDADDALFDAKVNWVQTLSGKDLKRERKKVLESMLDTSPEHKATAIGAMESGCSHIPYRLLSDLNRSKLQLRYMNFAGRGNYSESGYINIYKTHDKNRVIAHEMGHAIDSFMASGARGFSGKFGRWVTSPYATEAESKVYRGWFMKNRLPSGAKGDFYNGDGKYWKGKWIENYEARIYAGQGRFSQFFSTGMERYNKAFNIFRSERFDDYVNNIKGVIDKNIAVLNKLNPKSKEYRTLLATVNINKSDLDKLYPITKTYEQAKWDWAMNQGVWAKQKKFYPEYANWIEDFYGRISTMAGRAKYQFGFTHRLKGATVGIVDEVKKIDVGKMVSKTMEKVTRNYKVRTEKWAEKSWKTWFDGLNENEIDSLSKYTGDMLGEGVSDYIYINNYLRKGKPPLSARLKKVVKGMDSAMKKGIVAEDTIVYRGIDGKYLDYFEKNKGKMIVDKGFGSTTVRKGTAINYMDQAYDMTLLEERTIPILGKIQIPKGAKGSFLSYPDIDIELFADGEILLDRGTKFRIVDIVKKRSTGQEAYANYWEVLMEVIL